MKYTVLVILFNIVLLMSLLVLFFMPIAIFGMDGMSFFTGRTIFFIVGLAVVCFGVNFVLYRHYPLFSALEKEDWTRLVHILERRITEKKRLYNYQAALLCNAYIITSNFDGINRLEEYVKTSFPHVYSRNVLRFAAFALLRKDYAHVLHTLDSHKGANKNNIDWIAFYRGFVQYLEKQFDAALAAWGPSLNTVSSPLVAGLLVWLIETQLAVVCADEAQKYLESAAAQKKQLGKSFSKRSWDSAVSGVKNELYGAVCANLLDDAGTYIFG